VLHYPSIARHCLAVCNIDVHAEQVERVCPDGDGNGDCHKYSSEPCMCGNFGSTRLDWAGQLCLDGTSLRRLSRCGSVRFHWEQQPGGTAMPACLLAEQSSVTHAASCPAASLPLLAVLKDGRRITETGQFVVHTDDGQNVRLSRPAPLLPACLPARPPAFLQVCLAGGPHVCTLAVHAACPHQQRPVQPHATCLLPAHPCSGGPRKSFWPQVRALLLPRASGAALLVPCWCPAAATPKVLLASAHPGPSAVCLLMCPTLLCAAGVRDLMPDVEGFATCEPAASSAAQVSSPCRPAPAGVHPPAHLPRTSWLPASQPKNNKCPALHLYCPCTADWGRGIWVCLYCDAYEYCGQPMGAYGNGERGVHIAFEVRMRAVFVSVQGRWVCCASAGARAAQWCAALGLLSSAIHAGHATCCPALPCPALPCPGMAADAAVEPGRHSVHRWRDAAGQGEGVWLRLLPL
jgi:hypothetical protein